MSGTLEHKRVATQKVKSLGLQADLRARAVVLAAEDSTVGNSLRDMIQLNEDDPALTALVEEFLRGKGIGKVKLCQDNMRFGQILTADVCLFSPASLTYTKITYVDLAMAPSCLHHCASAKHCCTYLSTCCKPAYQRACACKFCLPCSQHESVLLHI